MKLTQSHIRGIEHFIDSHGKVDSWAILSMLKTFYSLKAGDAAKVFMQWVGHRWSENNEIYLRHPELRNLKWEGDEIGYEIFLVQYVEICEELAMVN